MNVAPKASLASRFSGMAIARRPHLPRGPAANHWHWRRAGILLLGALGLAVTLTSPLMAREGYARTHAGAVYEGHVRFESNAVIVVSASRGIWVRLPLTNVFAVGLTPSSSPSNEEYGRTFPPEGLSAPWQSVDVGWVSEAGEARVRGQGIQIRTSGTNVFGKDDSFHFVGRPMADAGQWLGRVTAAEGRLSGSKAGLVVRENLGSGDRQVALLAGGNGQGGETLLFGAREKPGEPMKVIAERAVRLPRWLKLSRAGSQFSAFFSADGRRWTLLGRTSVTMPDEAMGGVAAMGGWGPADTQMDQVSHRREAGNDWFGPVVHLVGGSMQVGAIDRLNDAQLHFNTAYQAPIATRTVAHILFRPLSSKVARDVSAGRPGVYLASGEFVAGDVRGIRGGQVTMSSVPLGILHFDAGAELMALVLRKAGVPNRRPCRLTTANGSVWAAATMIIEGEWVVLKEPAFGVRRVPLYEVVELRWGPTA
jgi:hypothetical protein